MKQEPDVNLSCSSSCCFRYHGEISQYKSLKPFNFMGVRTNAHLHLRPSHNETKEGDVIKDTISVSYSVSKGTLVFLYMRLMMEYDSRKSRNLSLCHLHGTNKRNKTSVVEIIQIMLIVTMKERALEENKHCRDTDILPLDRMLGIWYVLQETSCQSR